MEGIKISGTLTFRLTLWYAVLFIVLSLAVFFLFYITLSSNLTRRIDEELAEDANEIIPILESGRPEALREYIKEEEDPEDSEKEFFLVLSPGLEIMASTDLGSWNGLYPAPVFLMKLENGREVIKSVSLPGRENKIRVIYKKTSGGVIQKGMSLEDDEELLESLRSIFGTTAAVVLLSGSLFGWLMARRAMSGVERVRETAALIGRGDLSSRVPIGREGLEIENLALVFNEMLDKIEALVREIKEVTHNIAHDLRSPTTRIRGICETTLGSIPDADNCRDAFGTVINECDRLTGMINTLLEIAETEAGVAPLDKTSMDMNKLAVDAYELFHPVAEDKGVHLDLQSGEGPLTVKGDVARLQRAVANLLDNAIKYTPPGGRVILSVTGGPEHVILTVSDTGKGIDEKTLSRVFDRFYRGDESRSTPGNGLGLSLARALVAAHGGRIEVRSAPGKGSEFTILLPGEWPSG